MMKSRLMSAAVAGLLFCGMAQAQETVKKLTDMNLPGEWVPYQYNKAAGKLAVRPEFPEILKGKGDTESALGVKIDWPGGEAMSFFSVVPANKQALTIPFKVLKASLWVKGSGFGDFVEMHFVGPGGVDKDPKGKAMKVGLGKMSFADWQKCEIVIPADWPQPLTVKSVTCHNWGLQQPGASTVYFTRLEVTIDSSQSLGTEAAPAKSTTDDSW